MVSAYSQSVSQSFPIAGLIIAALLVSVLFAIFLSMIPKEPKAADPQDEYHFLAQFDENFGSAVFLAGLIDYSMGKVLAVAAVGGNFDASGVLELLLAIIFSMVTFFVDGVAMAVEHTGGACFVGILGFTLSGLSLSLAAASLVKRPSLGGIGLVVAYYALAITLFGLALVRSRVIQDMSSTTAARRDGTTDAATSRYSNPIGWFLCVLAAIVAPTVILIASPVFGLVRYWGWSGALVLAAFGGSCVLAVMSISVFVSVGIQPGRVVLRGLLHSTIVTSGEVETIRLDPPVHTLRMAWGFGRRWSVFTINRKGKAPIEASPMPDGLKLRIANALRPEDFPLPDE